jgi:CRP/FNR family transcriptional regulator, nitrogen fixation regulation protein
MRAGFQTLQRTHRTSEQARQPGPMPDALDLLEQFGSPDSAQRGCEIYGQGEPAEFCWQILSGCVRTARIMEDGRRQVSEFLWPGDFLGLDDLDAHEFSAETVTDAVLRRYPRRMVDALAQSHIALSVRLRAMTAAKLRRAHERMILLGCKSATEKVTYFLLETDRRSDSTGSRLLDLPMSRTDMADYLGLAIETVCRTLAHLRYDGVLLVSPAGIELRDRPALLKLVGSA